MIAKLIRKYRRRPFPQNVASLRTCRISYSQFGEDLFLTHLLGYEKTDGVYVDIGCYHPISYSNTYIFYQRGWSGLVIDPNRAWAPDWHRYRPRDKFVNCAISSKPGRNAFLVDPTHPACSHLLNSDAGTDVTGHQGVTSVDARRMDDVLQNHLGPRKIDLLTIDCEGHDLDVLSTNDFSLWRPTVIAVEDMTMSPDSPICAFLDGHGYDCKAYIGLTKIFRSRSD
jgi:FkbM family methyltransferase